MTPIDSDPWHKRNCTSCGEEFRPRRNYAPSRAAKSLCCSKSCASTLGSIAAHAGGHRPRGGRPTGAICKELSGVDLVPCTKCSIRGHVAGDPVKCLQPLATTGLGQQVWV